MYFKRSQKIAYGLDQITVTPLINVFFLLLIFFVFSLFLSTQNTIAVKLPKALTSAAIKEEDLVIIITSEDVVYIDDKVTTMKELRQALSKKENRKHPVLIKADRRSSVGRIVDVWNLSRELGVEKINIASSEIK